MNTHTPQTAGIGTTGIIIILAGLAVLLGIFITITSGSDTQEQAQATGPGALETVAQQRSIEETSVVTDVAADRADTLEAAAPPTPATVSAAGIYTDYDASKLQADATNVLFFHADWCPSCRGLDKDITANLSEIPSNINILKLDYDSEAELKKKYGVIRQHTLVVVDADGNQIKKLTGLTNTLDQVVSQL